MEPGPHGREEAVPSASGSIPYGTPQWSPALTAGKSRPRCLRRSRPSARRNGARPSRPGRVDWFRRLGQLVERAAMEPGPHGREEGSATWAAWSPFSLPQWSPALTGRLTISTRQASKGPFSLPQWSPALTAGKRRQGAGAPAEHDRAAMEPGPHGREEGSQES